MGSMRREVAERYKTFIFVDVKRLRSDITDKIRG
jgi:hypothetical protein